MAQKLLTIEKMLLKEHSKVQTERIAKYIENNPGTFKELMNLCFSDDVLLVQRGSWVMRTVIEKQPKLLRPYLEKLILKLETTTHAALKRNTLALLQNTAIPEQLLGSITNTCFSFLSKPSEPIAIHVFSMTVLLNTVKQFPDLKNELKVILQQQLPYGSPGYRSRAKKTLKELDKIA